MGDRIETRATWIIYEGARRPLVLDAKREPVRTHPAKPCGRCDDPQGVYRFADVVSENFIPTSNASVMLGGVDAMCVACAFCARDLKLRCAPFFARTDGIWFLRARHLLRALIDPPEAPFVVVAPLYGAEGGGESAGWRAVWSTDPPLPAGLDILNRMQAKCTAPYAETARSRVRFKLQVDADQCVTVDVPLWRATLAALDALTEALRGARCGYTEMRGAITTLRLPAPAKWHDARALGAVARQWSALTAPLRPHLASPWFRLVTERLYEIQGAAKAPAKGPVE